MTALGQQTVRGMRLGRMHVFVRLGIVLCAAFVLWIGSPAGSYFLTTDPGAARADSGHSGSGSGNSGSGSDDDDDDDSSSGSGSSGSGSGSSGSSSSGSSGSSPGKKGLSKNWIGGANLQVQFSDGHIERVFGGRFEVLDKNGRIKSRSAANANDIARLEALGQNISSQGGSRKIQTVARFDPSLTSAEILDYRGWREVFANGVYALTDPKGRMVKSRSVKQSDLVRLRALLGF